MEEFSMIKLSWNTFKNEAEIDEENRKSLTALRYKTGELTT